jgi:phage tail-like protein
MVTGNRIDPYLGFNFLVEIGSLVVGGFSEVTGLQAEVQTEDYREGGVNEYAHKLAGPTNYPANQSQRASPTPMPSGTGTEKSPRA